MRDQTTFISVDEVRAATLDSAKAFIAVIENHTFMKERIGRSMQSAFSLPVITYSTVAQLEDQLWKGSPGLVIFSLMQGNQAKIGMLPVLLELVPTIPVIVLASVDDVDLARTALNLGANGYISVTEGFEIAIEAVIEAVRFVFDEPPRHEACVTS